MTTAHVPECEKAIKVVLIYEPDLPTDQLMHRLRAIGYEPTAFAVSTVRSSFRQDLRILAEEGLIEPLPPKHEPPAWLMRAQSAAVEAETKPSSRKRRSLRHRQAMRKGKGKPKPYRNWWPEDDG